MTTSNAVRLIRKPEVLDRLNISKSTFYERLNKGLLPPAIPLGERAVGWLDHEITLLISAMATGYSEADLKGLIKDMVEKRRQELEQLM